MNENFKAGVKTSEFWLSAGSLVTAAATALGLLPQDTDLEHATSVIATTLLSAWIAGQYITGRNTLKSGEREQLREMRKMLSELVSQRTASPSEAQEK